MSTARTPLRRCIPADLVEQLEQTSTPKSTLPLYIAPEPPVGYAVARLWFSENQTVQISVQGGGTTRDNGTTHAYVRCPHPHDKNVASELDHLETCATGISALVSLQEARAQRSPAELVVSLVFDQGAVMLGNDAGALDDEDEAALDIESLRGAAAKISAAAIPGVCHCGKEPTKLDTAAQLPSKVRRALPYRAHNPQYTVVCDECASIHALSLEEVSKLTGIAFSFDKTLTAETGSLTSCHKHSAGLVRSTKAALPLVVGGMLLSIALIVAIPVSMFWYGHHIFDQHFDDILMDVSSIESRQCGPDSCRTAYNVEYHGVKGDLETIVILDEGKSQPSPKQFLLSYDNHSKMIRESVSNETLWYVWGILVSLVGFVAILAMVAYALDAHIIHDTRAMLANHWLRKNGDPSRKKAAPLYLEEEEW